MPRGEPCKSEMPSGWPRGDCAAAASVKCLLPKWNTIHKWPADDDAWSSEDFRRARLVNSLNLAPIKHAGWRAYLMDEFRYDGQKKKKCPLRIQALNLCGFDDSNWTLHDWNWTYMHASMHEKLLDSFWKKLQSVKKRKRGKKEQEEEETKRRSVVFWRGAYRRLA